MKEQGWAKNDVKEKGRQRRGRQRRRMTKKAKRLRKEGEMTLIEDEKQREWEGDYCGECK